VFMEGYLRFRAGLLGAGFLVPGFRGAGVLGEAASTAVFGAAAAAGAGPLAVVALLSAVLPAFFLAVFPAAFLAAFLASFFAAPRAAFRLRRDAASPAGPNLNNPVGWSPGAICARASDKTTPMAHRDMSSAEPP
jgi:hypothetical protein